MLKLKFTAVRDRTMKTLVIIIGIAWFAVFALYIVDHAETVDIINLHETIPFNIFGLIWVIVGFCTIMPLSRMAQKKDRE